MRRLTLLAGVLALTLALVTAAHAIPLFPVTDFKFTGHTAVYNPNLGAYQVAGYTPKVGDQIWSVGKITGTVNPVTGDYYPLGANEEYTYMSGGLVVKVNPAPGKYYLSADPNSPVKDAGGNGLPFIVVWKETVPDYSLTSNPQTWAGAVPPYPVADPAGTIINDGTPWLTAVMEGDPTWNCPCSVYQANITNFGIPVGSDNAYFHLQMLPVTPWGNNLLGSFNSMIGPTNYYGLGNHGLTRDAQMLCTMQASMVGGFYNRDNNPVTAPIVPEPCTMLLLGTGLLGVGVATRHRMRKG